VAWAYPAMEAETPGAAGNGVETAAGAEVGGAAPVDSAVVQEALEAMLSKKNLVKDPFLASSMNPQMYIPVRVLLGHERMQALGATEEAVIDAASRSAKLGVDDQRTMVRPMLKSKRNVVILRELPVGTTEEEIRELLSRAPHADRIASVKPEVNNTWFVKFNLDDGTQDVVLWLRSQLFKDQPINAAIKSEHFLRSFFPLHMASGGVPTPQMGYAMGDRSGGAEGQEMVSGTSWAEQSANMDLGGKGVLPMVSMQSPMHMQMGLQGPGYWQPWGARHQPPPLVFSSSTPAPMPVVSEQAAHMGPDILDNLDLDDDDQLSFAFDGKGGKGGAKGKGKGKGKSWMGKDGKDGGGGAKGWASSGRITDWYAASSHGKDQGGFMTAGYGKNSGGWGGNDWGGKDRGGKGWSGGGVQGWAGGAPSQGKGSSWAPAEQKKGASKGEKNDNSERGGGGGGGRGRGWAPRLRDTAAAPAAGSSASAGVATSAPAAAAAEIAPVSVPAPAPKVFREDHRRYTREDFEQISDTMRSEQLTRPCALDALGTDLPVLKEAPSVELAPATQG